MKAKLLTLFSLLALLLVSTATLADGRPTGIRIGRVSNVSAVRVEIDITVPATDLLYTGGLYIGSTSVWLGRSLGNTYPNGFRAWQYASPTHSELLPWAIEWGDSSSLGRVALVGPPGGPFTGTFMHTYASAGGLETYTITVGDVLCCSPLINKGMGKGTGVTTGNVITGSNRYLFTTSDFSNTFTSTVNARLAVTNTATATTRTAIPALNIYGLLAMAFVLVGTGVLLYRKPQRTVA